MRLGKMLALPLLTGVLESFVPGDHSPMHPYAARARSHGGAALLSTLPIGSAEEVQSRYAALPLGPQEYESRDEPKSASPGMENTPPPNHAARFSRGTARRCVHQAAIDRHDNDDRVGPIY